MAFVRYAMAMAKHTSMYLDEELVQQAGEILGTSGPTGTVRAALEEVVRRARLQNLAGWEVELNDTQLDELRQPRVATTE